MKNTLRASQKTKKTPAGEIPVDWACVKLSDTIAGLEAGTSVSGVDRQATNTEIGVLKVSAVSQGRFRPCENKAVLTPSEMARVTVEPEVGCLLISRSNSPDLVGDVALVTEPTKNLFLPDKLWLVRTRSEAPVSAKWLLHQLRSPNTGLELKSRASGTSDSMKNISKESFFSLAIPLPPLPEQHRIADILTTWDEALENLDALIAAQERRKQGLMRQLFQPDTKGKNKSIKWVKANLGELFSERVEQNRADLPLLSITADRGVVPRGELAKRDTSSEDKSKYLRIAPGDIGYNTMRMWQGVSALSTLEGIVSPAYTICVPNARMDARFAAHFFKYRHTVHLFHRYSQGLVEDTLNLKYPSFALIEVAVPAEINAQKRIAAILDSQDHQTTNLRAQRDALERQKRGLMQRLLTGKIRVKP